MRTIIGWCLFEKKICQNDDEEHTYQISRFKNYFDSILMRRLRRNFYHYGSKSTKNVSSFQKALQEMDTFDESFSFQKMRLFLKIFAHFEVTRVALLPFALDQITTMFRFPIGPI